MNLKAIAGTLLPVGLVAGHLSGQNVNYVNSPALSTPPGYSHAVVVEHGRIVYLSGQVGLNAKGEVAGDFRAQATQAFANLRAALAAAGGTPAELIKLNYYVVGLNHEKLVALREARDGFIDKAHPPASTLAGVQSLFREDCQIEIEGVAVLPEKPTGKH